jgi:hypothetical protein
LSLVAGITRLQRSQLDRWDTRNQRTARKKPTNG